MRSPSLCTPPREWTRTPTEPVNGSSSKRSLNGEPWTTVTVKEEGTPSIHPRSKMLLSSLTLKKESVQRRERREKELEREIDRERQIHAGGKRNYINVNQDGKPYGLGITAWNDALGKVVRGLDPSYIDIRHQPFHLMEILMNRLNEDFKYSADINPSWFRTRVENALSSYRHELIKMIQAKEDRPAWVTENIWSKLQELEASQKFRVKSEQMRFANSCRRTKGRTGPLGEVGITERLRQQLGRHPDPDEVQEEMLRDKGYSGRVRSISAARGSPGGTTYRLGERTGTSTTSQRSVSLCADESPRINVTPVSKDNGAVGKTAGGNEGNSDRADAANPSTEDKPVIRILIQQIEELKKLQCGDPGDVNIVVQSLMKQVETLRSRNLATHSNMQGVAEGCIGVLIREILDGGEQSAEKGVHEVSFERMSRALVNCT